MESIYASLLQGVQLFIEVADRDPINGFDDIIDRFFINIFRAANTSIILGVESPRTSYRGAFKTAQMELSLRVDCAENFARPDCFHCEAGYTGPFCRTDIDECQGVDCSGHGQCEDGRSSFTCNCEPGFTGELCDTTITDEATDNSLQESSTHSGVYVGVGVGIVVVIVINIVAVVTVAMVITKRKKQKFFETTAGTL